jgi:hypothetical protein
LVIIGDAVHHPLKRRHRHHRLRHLAAAAAMKRIFGIAGETTNRIDC